MEPSKIQWDFQDNGEFLLVDKPLDWSSFDVVKKIKVLFSVRRVGHAGTLDPKATGLLIICTGKKTKTLDSFQSEEKEYTGSFELGVRTASFDSETQVLETKDFAHVTENVLDLAVKRFTGKILQTPPMFSAAKIDGKPLYLYARKGKSVDRAAREIEIHDFQITGFFPPMVDFKVICSKGTYIRTLVEDLGRELGCGCTLRSLRRTRIGTHRVEDAMSIEDLMVLRQALESRAPQSYEVSEPA
jgi:tRNA pseudouridine55 synthase